MSDRVSVVTYPPEEPNIRERIKHIRLANQLLKTLWYSRLRQYFPMPEPALVDDRESIQDAEPVIIDWPASVPKPVVGIVQDHGPYPWWTKFCRFLENNAFSYGFFDIHAHDWLARAQEFDAIIGLATNELFHLDELRRKYHVLDRLLGIPCYPSADHFALYEDKMLEAYICQCSNLPFAPTYISHNREDALRLIDTLDFPIVSKVVPSSGSVGVERVDTPQRAREIVARAFSRNGRKVHVNYFSQKNYIYWQSYIPNDGYDLRVILIGNAAFGFYRRILKGDFRASGMNLWEKRALPPEAIRLAQRVNQVIKSPLLAVDMLYGLDNQYHIIEISPIAGVIDSADQLRVEGVPGVYLSDEDGSIRFQPGKYWVQELALREFLLTGYLPRMGP